MKGVDRPYLSLVIAVRNDNYGGDFTERLQRSLLWNTRFLEQYAIQAEFVLVNWNPLADEVPLSNRLKWPSGRKYVSYRIVDVPEELHQTYVNPAVRDTVPMFEFIAKNAGVRRAQGEYVLCTNADILIHPDIFKTIGNGNLNSQHYYRANRLDFRKTENDTVKSMFSNGLTVMLKGKGYHLNWSNFKQMEYEWLRIRNAISLKWEAWKLRHVKFSNRWGLNVVHDNGPLLTHSNCAGDFMLMHRDNWFKLRSYPEYTYTVMHKDAKLAILALSMLKEKVFAAPIFHQDHERRYGWALNSHDEKYDKAYDLFIEIAHEVREGRPIDRFLNDENWGLGNIQLSEQYF